MKEIGQLFLVFLKIGTFIFGGGYAMVPAIRRETSEVRNWISEEQLSDCIAVCQSLPGAFAVNAAIFIGKRVKGTAGAFAGLLGITLPAFVSILIVLLFLGQIQENVYVQGALEGIKAASVALILITIFQMSQTMMKNKLSYLISAFSFGMILLLEISAIWAIAVGGILGFLGHLWTKSNIKKNGNAGDDSGRKRKEEN